MPAHVAIIMDGNGRWALSRGLKRSDGHREGVKRVQEIVECSIRLGVKHLTIYTFSNENWSRPVSEIDALFSLLAQNLLKQIGKMKKNGVRLHAIGNVKKMPLLIQQRLKAAMKETATNNVLHLTIAISYSSKWEITQAVKQIAQKVAQGKLSPKDIDDETIRTHITTAHSPDPDLLIRTGGEHRVSNFLLYQIAYAELFFTDTCWPEFSELEYTKIIESFKSRTRTFGSVHIS